MEDYRHEVHRNPDGTFYWLTCEGEEYARFTQDKIVGAYDPEIALKEFFNREFEKHMKEKHPEDRLNDY